MIENLRQPSFLPQKRKYRECGWDTQYIYVDITRQRRKGYKYMSICLLIFILFFSPQNEEILSISVVKCFHY